MEQRSLLKWADCHCHLDELPDPGKAVQDAIERGVTKICAVAEFSSVESWNKIISLSQNSAPNVVIAGIGVHPCPSTDELLFNHVDSSAISRQLLATCQQNQQIVQVIGEIGLDFKHANTPELATVQLRLLSEQLSIAKQLKLPISVHSRRAAKQIVEICSLFYRETGLGCCLHWFTHNGNLMKQAVNSGLFVSVGPAGAMFEIDEKKIVSKVGKDCLNRMLTETDAPVPFGGNPSEPSWIPDVGEAIAKLINVPIEMISEKTYSNFETYLSIGRS